MPDILIKIHQGTGQQTGTSLCRSCRYGHILTDRQGDQMTCQMQPRLHIRGSVHECSSYYNATLPSMDDMYRTAWTLRTEKGGRHIGFAPPKTDEDGTPK